METASEGWQSRFGSALSDELGTRVSRVASGWRFGRHLVQLNVQGSDVTVLIMEAVSGEYGYTPQTIPASFASDPAAIAKVVATWCVANNPPV